MMINNTKKPLYTVYEVFESNKPYQFFKIWNENKEQYDIITVKRESKKALELKNMELETDEKKNNYEQNIKDFRAGDMEKLNELFEFGHIFKKGDYRAIEKYIKMADENHKILFKINNREYTATNKNFKKFKKLMKQLYIIEDDEKTKTGSDLLDNYLITEIYKMEIIKINKPLKKYDNKNAGLFKYFNKSNINLERYQIKKTNEDNISPEHCIIHTLKLYGIPRDILNNIKLSFQNGYNFPVCKLNKLCDEIKCKINLFMVRDNNTANKHIYYNRMYGDKKYNRVLDIALYKEHYFIYEPVNYTLFSIKKYETINHLKNYNLATQKNGLGIQSINPKFINSLSLLHNMFNINLFINNYESYKTNYDVKNIYLENIENEQEIYMKKDVEKNKKIVFYADTETQTEGSHKVLLSGIIDDYDPKPNINTGHNSIYKMLDYASIKKDEEEKKQNEKYDIIIYFHNLKYDFHAMKNNLFIISRCIKDGQLYSVDIKHKYNNIFNKIKLVDSYKMAPFALSKFNKVFSLPSKYNKKECINYGYYNFENLNNKEVDINFYSLNLTGGKTKEDLMTNILKNKKLLEYNDIKNTFNPIKYYKYYLKYDVLILRAGMQKLKNNMLELTNININNKLTISSLVDENIKNEGCFDNIYNVSGNLREFVAGAVYGGRVAVNDKYIKKEIKEKINDLDKVSLYPAAIVRLNKEMGLPTGKCKEIKNLNFNEIQKYIYYIVEIKILEINKKQQIPFIGIKKDGILKYINELENNEPIILTVDKITLEDYIKFHKIKFEIIKGIYWNEGINKKMGDFVNNLFNVRLNYKKLMKTLKENDEQYKALDIQQELIKLMLNSIYGKTITKKTKEKEIIKTKGTKTNDYIFNNYNTIKNIEDINDNQKIIKCLDVDTSANFGHIGVLILSYSKRIMNEILNIANDNNINIYYQDTDSLHLDDNDIKLLSELYEQEYDIKLLGENIENFHSDFKLEGIKKGTSPISTTSIFLGKKSYIDVLSGLNEENNIIIGYHMRLKGITKSGLEKASKEHGGNLELYKKLMSGQEIKFILNPEGAMPIFKYDNKKGVYFASEMIRKLKF